MEFPQGGAELPAQDERTLVVAAHLLGLFAGFLGPLIVWLIRKDQSAFVDDQAKEALNFQLTVLIAAVALGVMSVVLGVLTLGIASLLMMPLFVVIGVGVLVLCIVAAVAANGGERYRYPVCWRLIR